MNDAKQSAEANPTNATPPPESPPGNGRRGPTSTDQLAEIGRLIRGEDAPDDVDDGAQERPGDVNGKEPARQAKGGKRTPPKTLEAAAKALGLDVAALYDLEIPMRAGDAKSVKKLGDLKDYFADQDSHQVERLAWEEERGKQSASIQRERAEMAEILQAIPPDKLNAEVVNRARQRLDAQVASERRKTLERIPAWRDEEARTNDLTGIAEHLADYGFPPGALQAISDSRMLAYMRDNWLRMKRINDALEKVKAVRPATPQRSRSAAGSAPQKSPVRLQQGTRTLETQVDAISKLLRS